MYQSIKAQIEGAQAQLIVVSKTQPLPKIEAIYHQGQRAFGENRVQDLVEKYEVLPKDIKWHLIGHLQTNKVKYIAPFIHLIHSIDSLKLLQEVNKEARKLKRCIDVLLQFHVAQEETKFGLTMHEANELLEYYTAHQSELKHVRIVGIMGMASFTDNTNQVREEFAHLKNIFTLIKQSYFPLEASFKELSMGMSGDYELALEQGATMVRIGSLLFQNES